MMDTVFDLHVKWKFYPFLRQALFLFFVLQKMECLNLDPQMQNGRGRNVSRTSRFLFVQ